MNLFGWKRGRQGGGYSKLLLVSSKFFKFDVHVIKFNVNDHVPIHNDPAPGHQHHRINFVLRRAFQGGETWIRPTPGTTHFDLEGRVLYRFRPDIQEHYVTPVVEGELILLSIGWLRKN